MTMQKRPLSGMVDPVSGLAKPIAIGVGPTLIHTEDGTTPQQAGPFADEVTVIANNPTGAPIVLTLVVNGVSLVVAVPAQSSLPVLAGAIFRSADGQPGSVIQGSGAGVIIWGWFARPL